MQAILTKYLGPTNTRGSRVIAYCDGGRISVAYQYNMSPEGNHRYAILKLGIKLGWIQEADAQLNTDYPSAPGWHFGSTPTGYVGVQEVTP